MFTNAKSKIIRLTLWACLMLPLGYGLLQPAAADAAPRYRGRVIARRVVPVPVYPWYPGYGWYWNGFRWVR